MIEATMLTNTCNHKDFVSVDYIRRKGLGKLKCELVEMVKMSDDIILHANLYSECCSTLNMMFYLGFLPKDEYQNLHDMVSDLYRKRTYLCNVLRHIEQLTQ